MKVIEIGTLASYCRKNELCTGMCITQWNAMLNYAANNYKEPTYIRDLAVVIKFCSTTNKTISEIENDLSEMALTD